MELRRRQVNLFYLLLFFKLKIWVIFFKFLILNLNFPPKIQINKKKFFSEIRGITNYFN